MQRVRNPLWLLTLILLVVPVAAPAANPSSTDSRPDPKSVQRYGPAYRYPQAGWIVLHIEGEPYERGYQHGRLLAPEIAAAIRGAAIFLNPKAPMEGWKQTRSLVNALFARRYEKEFLEEMKGIADGAAEAGARLEGRPIDLLDVISYNAWPEVETLDSALEATPLGLEGMRFPHQQPRAMPAPKPMHCSAFAATGPATADGKIVFGHITMFGLYPSYYYNVWLDIKPAKGHRVLMQTYPGGIQSGLDYYMNDAGLVVCETTLAQTRFDVTGMSLASRIRQALQYADSIDKAVAILKAGNNGLYTNEWLLADVKTNEIAMFELGTHKSRLYRSSRGDWFGGTEGFYWGCNNTKDLEVRLETLASVKERPANMVFCPSERDQTWVRLYHQYKGRIDAQFGKVAFTTPPVAAYHSLDAKFTTTDLAKDLKSWALFGPPLGRTWQPTQEERQRYPEIQPLVSNPWTILHTTPPNRVDERGPVAMDLQGRTEAPEEVVARRERRRQSSSVPVWHGTLLPKTDADTWLATAFADYERFLAEERALRERRETSEAGKSALTQEDRDRLAVSLFGIRSSYLAAARTGADVPLASTRADVTQSAWYRVASGKGVWLLHELRGLLGERAFTDLMEAFGREHAGQAVTSAQFQAHVEKVHGSRLDSYFTYWLQQAGLPVLQLSDVKAAPKEKGHQVEGTIAYQGRNLPKASVKVTVETAQGEVTRTITLEGKSNRFTIEVAERPLRVIVDKYGQKAKDNGGVYTVLSFQRELGQTLIVFGTADEVPTNREAAEALQRAIIERGSNYTVGIKADLEVTEEDLKSHHLLLVGRPDSNTVLRRFQQALPLTFGSRSFTVRQETYAHPGSAVLAAAENPLNPRFSLVAIAGLSAESTLRAAPLLLGGGTRHAEVVVLANQARPKALIVPARELVKELAQGNESRAER